jgi:hypothetical protein
VTLTMLWLSENSFGDAGAIGIANALDDNETRMHLFLNLSKIRASKSARRAIETSWESTPSRKGGLRPLCCACSAGDDGCEFGCAWSLRLVSGG